VASGSKQRSRFFKIQVFAHILWLALPLYFYGRLLTSSAYQRSLDLAKSSPDLQKILGDDIHAQLFPVGSALRWYNSDFAEWSVSMSGSLGHGHLYGVANHVGPEWEFSRLTFVSAGGSAAIDLTPKPARLDVPQVGPKKVYLIPLNLDPEESLDWAPAYYKAKLGAEVEILPPIALTLAEKDEKRNQYVAEKCIDLIANIHQDLANDPSNILIGVTSQDLYIAAYHWKYAENFREEGRLAVVSEARLRPMDYPGIWNKALLSSRLQKMLTKNIAVMYSNLPLSNDYTSLLSAGVLSGKQVDYMSEEIVGAERRWDSLASDGDPVVSITALPDKLPVWMVDEAWQRLENPGTQYFMVDLATGLFTQREMDFYIKDTYPLYFNRMYRNADDRSRALGVGTSDGLDIYLVGQMGSFIDLVNEEGSRVHFVHVEPKANEPSQLYRAADDSQFVDAVYDDNTWRLRRRDGWTYFFPYRPKAFESQVTVLTGFTDAQGHKYSMTRDDSGDLITVTTPSGQWLHFEHDDKHHIHRVQGSNGRAVQYDYNSSGQLVRVCDSNGNAEFYTYNDRNEMLSIVDGANKLLLKNEYTSNNLISSQTLGDGRHFEYWYNFAPRMAIAQSYFTDPNGLMTFFDYDGRGRFLRSLPTRPPH
jgi:YD repeat-containing protein